MASLDILVENYHQVTSPPSAYLENQVLNTEVCFSSSRGKLDSSSWLHASGNFLSGNVPEAEVRCGERREVAACLDRVRIVGGDQAGCNEWPWQVVDDDYLTW